MLWAFQNNLDFSICAVPFAYFLVTTSEVEAEFNRKSTNKNKCVDLTLKFSVNSMETMINYQTGDL